MPIKKFEPPRIQLPKSVYRSGDEKRKPFRVVIRSRITHKNITVGTYNTVAEAVAARDKYVCENYDKIGGYTPRGVTYNDSTQKYQVYIGFKLRDRQIQEILGYFETLQEAIDYRTAFLDGLK